MSGRYRSKTGLGRGLLGTKRLSDHFDVATGATGTLIVAEVLLCLTLWGPQPAAWLWVGGHVQGWTHNIEAAITVAFTGMLITLFFTLVIVKRLDHSWRLVRRAAGHNQTSGVVERVFIVSAGVALIAFTFWFLVIAGPGPQLAPTH